MKNISIKITGYLFVALMTLPLFGMEKKKATVISGKIGLYSGKGASRQFISFAAKGQHEATGKIIDSYKKNNSSEFDITVPLVPVLISLEEGKAWADDIPYKIKKDMRVKDDLPAPYAIPITLLQKNDGSFISANEVIKLRMYGLDFELVCSNNFKTLKEWTYTCVGQACLAPSWWFGRNLNSNEELSIQSALEGTDSNSWINQYCKTVEAAKTAEKIKEEKKNDSSGQKNAEQENVAVSQVTKQDTDQVANKTTLIEDKATKESTDKFAWIKNYSIKSYLVGVAFVAGLLVYCKACNYDIMNLFKMAWS